MNRKTPRRDQTHASNGVNAAMSDRQDRIAEQLAIGRDEIRRGQAAPLERLEALLLAARAARGFPTR